MLDCGLDLERVPARGGSYVLILRLSGRPRRVRVGALGMVEFAPGCYCYVGSARSGLRSRLARHLRLKPKRKHWHIDYLRPHTCPVGMLVAEAAMEECDLSRRIGELADGGVAGFGASDCPCDGHLHYFARDPRPYIKKGRIG